MIKKDVVLLAEKKVSRNDKEYVDYRLLIDGVEVRIQLDYNLSSVIYQILSRDNK